MEFVPLFYYPTQVVWIDDDELFLQSAAQRFKDTFSIKFFLSPDECLTALRDYSAVSTSLPLLKICREYEEYGMADHLLADINLDSIYSLKNNEKRLQDISVMVVDYNMPGKTGIELCHELREWPIKKILLTGEASHQVAIDAFNEGAIDCFIRKDALTFSTDLTQYIQKFQLQYFIKLTDSLLSHLEADYKLPQSDPQFFAFFEKWIKENDICEYYLLDRYGKFLTLNKNSEARYFIIHTDRSLNEFASLYAEDIKDPDIINLINAVNHRTKIPFFGFKKESWNFEFSRWTEHFYSPNLITGKERYYWAIA